MCPWKLCFRQEKEIHLSFGEKISGLGVGWGWGEKHCLRSPYPSPSLSEAFIDSPHPTPICSHSLLFCPQSCSPTLGSLFPGTLFYSLNGYFKKCTSFSLGSILNSRHIQILPLIQPLDLLWIPHIESLNSHLARP